MDRIIKGGTADVSIDVYIIDETTGIPETGVVFNEAGIDLKYRREGAAVVAIVEVDLATPLLTDPHLDGGFLEIGNGVYRFDLPDAVCAAGVKHVTVFGTITGMIVLPVEIQLVAFDPDDTVRLGLTSLPNAAAEAAGGLYTRGAGAGQINQPANGAIDANAVSAVAAFFQDCFTVDSGEVSGAEVSGSLILEIVKVAWDRVLTGGTHNIATSAGRRLRGIQEFQGYENGAIWIDTVNGTAGTTDFENGTVENPVDSIADANTLAASLGITRFVVNPGSSITFAAAQEDQVFMGFNWTLALNGQSISGSRIVGAVVSGTATGATQPVFDKCDVGNVTLPGVHLENCGLTGTLTVSAADDYLLDDCHSNVPSNGDAIIDFAAAAASSIHLTRWCGGLDIRNMGQVGADLLHVMGWGDITLNANCVGGTLDIHGDWDITDNSITVTVVQTSAYNAGNVNAEVVDALNVDTYAEPGQGALPVSASMRLKLDYVYKYLRNLKKQNANTFELYDDAGAVVDQKATVSDAAGTSTKGELVSGP